MLLVFSACGVGAGNSFPGILLIQLRQVGRFVHAVRAPASHDLYDHDFILKSGIAQANGLATAVFERKANHLVRFV